jgi:ABC-2 type transport system permease protein
MSTATGRRASNALDVVVAFFRLDAIDELSYPMSMMFRFLAPLMSVVVYFFQAEFLGRPDAYAATLVGISLALSLQLALTGCGNRLQQLQERGNLEPVLVEPVSWWVIPITMNMWQTLAGVVTMGLMLGTGVLLGADLQVSGLLPFLLILTLGLIACNAVGILSASLIVLAKRSQAILGLYGLAASLLGGALFSIEVLPEWLRVFSYLVPHAYVISAARDVLVPGGVGAGMPLGVAVTGLVIFDLIAFPLGLYAFTKALEYSRTMGLLGGY